MEEEDDEDVDMGPVNNLNQVPDMFIAQIMQLRKLPDA